MSQKADKFVNLHVHSTYSFTKGYGTPEQHVNRVKELNQPALAITDYINVSSHFKWYTECKNNDITPILGCDLYIEKNVFGLSNSRALHITLLAKNNEGYKNLLKLVTIAWCENKQIHPKITFDELFEHQKGLIVLSGGVGSYLMEEVVGKEFDLFKEKLDDFYIEIQPDENAGFKKLIKLHDRLKKSGHKFVATNNVHYVNSDQHEISDVLLCIREKDVMSNPDRLMNLRKDLHLKSRKEMEESLSEHFKEFDFKEMLDNTVKISEEIDFEFPTTSPVKYQMKDEDKFKYLYDITFKGLERMGKHKDKAYIDRMEYELNIVKEKNFVDYFLVIWDLVAWTKDRNILVGPARGSAAGSLSCYCLRITEVDPIVHGLIFERFIDINREDLPDIDIDFEDARRHEIKDYLRDKYGNDRVGNLPTMMAFKGKSSIQDIGSAFRIPFKVTNKLKGMVLERSGGDSRASFTMADTFDNETFSYPREAMKEHPDLKYTIELEGQIRQMGQHAAGVVISDEPITNFCAMYKIKDEYVISLDYKDSSTIGLLKIDLLGLSTLTIISKTMDLIEERHGKTIDMYNLPLDDKKIYKGFNDGKLFGIFQFDGQAVNQVCRQIKPKDFGSLSAISALARPGPLNSGSTTSYIQRGMGKEKITYPHKVMKNFTEDTYGIVIYQEQVMKTMRELGKMSWKDTSEIRKLISRSQGVEKFNTFKDKFAIGARENGMSDEQIDVVWESICTFGSWAFNKSHSVAYSIISYWTMYLKMYYPLEFYSSSLALFDDSRKRKVIKEYIREGYKLYSVDVNKSKNNFSIDGEGIRIGFEDVKGIGSAAAGKISKNQPYKDYWDFGVKSHSSSAICKILAHIGAFSSIEENSLTNTLFEEGVLPYDKNVSFAERFTLCPWDMDFGVEKNWLGYLKSQTAFKNALPSPIEFLESKEGEDVVIYGGVYDKNLRDVREVSMSKGEDIDLSKYISRNGVEMFQFANFVVEDDTDFITVRLSYKLFQEPCANGLTEEKDGKKKKVTNGQLIFEHTRPDDVLLIRGKMGSGIRMFFVNKIMNLRIHKESGS